MDVTKKDYFSGKAKRQNFEFNVKELISKIEQLDQLKKQLRAEELATREQLQAMCQELKTDVEHHERRQRQLEDYLKNIPGFNIWTKSLFLVLTGAMDP